MLTIERQVAAISYDGTAKKETVRLPRDASVADIVFDLSFTDTVSAGATSGTVMTDAVACILSGIKLVAGNTVIKNLTGRQVWNPASLMAGTDPEHTPPANGDAGAKVCSVCLPLECMCKRMRDGWRTILETARFPELHLELDLALPTVMFSADHDRTNTISGGLLKVAYRQLVGRDRPRGQVVFQETNYPLNFATARTAERHALTVGLRYRRIILHSELTSGTDDADSNSLLSTLAVVGDGNLRIWDGNFLKLRNRNKQQYQRETLQTGWGVLDFITAGALKTALNAEQANSLELVFDSGADHRLTVIPGTFLAYQRG